MFVKGYNAKHSPVERIHSSSSCTVNPPLFIHRQTATICLSLLSGTFIEHIIIVLLTRTQIYLHSAKAYLAVDTFEFVCIKSSSV